jgi:hypothetical protein
MPARLSLVIAILAVSPAALLAANEDGAAVAVLDSGRTLAPVRTVTEWLGADVRWDSQSDQVIITGNDAALRLRPGSTEAFLNAEPVTLDEPPVILAGVTYVPARFVAEAFGVRVDCPGRCVQLHFIDGDRRLQMRVAVRENDWLTYRGPWFDIDYPASFRPLGYDHAPNSDDYDEDGIRFESPDGEVLFYVYSPLWSGDPAWPTVREGETVLERSTETRSAEYADIRLTWITVGGPQMGYRRSWQQTREGPSIEYFIGIRYDSQEAYDYWRDEYLRFKNSLVQYAD